MAELERTYNIPLRKEVMKAPRYKRANKAVRVIRKFLQRHMKSQNIKLGSYLNSKILEHGRKNIPHHIEVTAIKEKDVVRAELASSKDLSFIKPKIEDIKDKIKIKIPGLGKKTTTEIKEERTVQEAVFEKVEEKKEDLDQEKKKLEINQKTTDELQKEILTEKHRGKVTEDKEAIRSPRKSQEAETYARPSKKIQHKKPKKEKF